MKFFRFKQFQLTDEHSAMKVGMDAVLLGSLVQARDYRTILDVGCGSGLIALMMAQRFPEARITGVDIHEGSVRDAAYNFEHSPWAKRLKVVQTDFKEFAANEAFDLIISNPPFFNASLLPPEEARAGARHDYALPLADLILHARKLLHEDGIFALVYPYDREQQLCDIAAQSGLYPLRILRVRNKEGVKIKRSYIEFTPSGSKLSCEYTELEIRNPDGSYSGLYKKITRDFYLYF